MREEISRLTDAFTTAAERINNALPHVVCPECSARITTFTFWYVPAHRVYRKIWFIRWSRRCPGSMGTPAPREPLGQVSA